MATPVRKSRRVMTPKKYTVDPFAGKEDLLLETSDSGSDTSNPPTSEDEFDIVPVEAGEGKEVAVDDDEEAVSADESPASSDAEEPQPEDDEEDEDVVAIQSDVEATRSKKKVHPTRDQSGEFDMHKMPAFDTHAFKAMYNRDGPRGRVPRRGIPDLIHNLDKDNRVIYTVGTGTEDVIAHIQCRDKWINQATFPTRNSDKENSGGLAYSYFHTKEKREKELGQGWNWYYEEGGRDMFVKDQRISFLGTKGSHEILQRALCISDPFLIGPTRQPTLFEPLQPCTSIQTAKAWTSAKKPSKKIAWIINAGAKIQCLEWAPNQKGKWQYLAVVTAESENAKADQEDYPNVYTPAPSYQMCLQIWEFGVEEPTADQGCSIDYSKAPILRYVVSFGWGYLKRLKWCPVPARDPKIENESIVRLGLLAGVWADGYVRILDLHFTRSENTTPQNIYVSKAAFESKPPDTMCTGVAWLSSSSIAACCANGSVAIWNIPTHLKATSRNSDNAHPWFYREFHLSYILSIVSAYPSRPHFLITKGIDGFSRLTDLRNPTQDVIWSPRDRITQAPLIWHDVTQTALSTDDNFDIKSYAVRRFHLSHSVTRTDALVTSMGGSLVHPFILAGCADGSVWSSNPMKRLRSMRKGTTQQIWFKHEWRRPITLAQLGGPPPHDTTMQDAETTAGYTAPSPSTTNQQPTSVPPKNPAILAKPLIRFTEGYHLARPELNNSKRANSKDEVAFTTIYEEKSAITQVCWNPNLHCGTWAAAGTASGLVRVEDLGID
ncbi:hypothetical protein EJ08DRAFT_130327 [Tothia fuscella]|uniref:Transcription factor TFIIIC complex subunit Tfc6 n=1 Tax=Tothia fuscella TaxID=1048955 RepID=A0A9P4U0V9_9PEZI|nr:hypothetical protein EJ08DRAFT_130327 [Tothia fuscella]